MSKKTLFLASLLITTTLLSACGKNKNKVYEEDIVTISYTTTREDGTVFASTTQQVRGESTDYFDDMLVDTIVAGDNNHIWGDVIIDAMLDDTITGTIEPLIADYDDKKIQKIPALVFANQDTQPEVGDYYTIAQDTTGIVTSIEWDDQNAFIVIDLNPQHTYQSAQYSLTIDEITRPESQ